MIDLRSDTCSKPTPDMRRAMAEAEVGDDVYGDDPTVKELERRTAELLGKEDAVYVPSGTMANQIGIRLHTQAGDTILCDQAAHVYLIEGGQTASFGNVMTRLLPGVRGVCTPADVEAASARFHPFYPDVFSPVTLLCLENTHNGGGGTVWPLDRLKAVAEAGRGRGLALHLDGARLWHASAASGVGEADYAAPFDTVSVCFSKALGAPIGSCLAGSKALMARARRFKQQLGGGFRQAGIVAAGALYALEHHRPRLAETHANAQRFAQALAQLDGIVLDPAAVETNIVRYGLRDHDSGRFAEALHARGLHMLPSGPNALRAVFYLDITAGETDRAATIVAEALRDLV